MAVRSNAKQQVICGIGLASVWIQKKNVAKRVLLGKAGKGLRCVKSRLNSDIELELDDTNVEISMITVK